MDKFYERARVRSASIREDHHVDLIDIECGRRRRSAKSSGMVRSRILARAFPTEVVFVTVSQAARRRGRVIGGLNRGGSIEGAKREREGEV